MSKIPISLAVNIWSRRIFLLPPLLFFVSPVLPDVFISVPLSFPLSISAGGRHIKISPLCDNMAIFDRPLNDNELLKQQFQVRDSLIYFYLRALPAVWRVHLSMSVDRLFGVRAKRSLAIDTLSGVIIVVLGRNQFLRSSAILDPAHQSEKTVVLRVIESRHAMADIRQVLTGAADVPGRILAA